MKYRSRDGEVLDLICARQYGDASRRVEDVLAVNPGLAAHGPVLPAGLVIDLPDFGDDGAVAPTVRLWD